MKEGEVGGLCSMHVEMRCAYKILFGKPMGNMRFRTLKWKWSENVEISLREMWYRCSDWTELIEDRDQS